MNREFEVIGKWREPTGMPLSGILKFIPNQGGWLTVFGTFKNVTKNDLNINDHNLNFDQIKEQINPKPEI